ncbi:MAG: DUF3052 domain-containing protein [Cyclobacteriaceae bacterium]
MSTAGYSGTPLVKKLGIKPNFKCLILHEPQHYIDLLFEIPENTEFTDEANGTFDFIHAFYRKVDNLKTEWPQLKKSLKKDGSLWVSWPKGSSKIETDMNANDVRRIGLQGGLVDVKVCAFDNDWSGLKFMFRKTDR